jgi:osmotically-inducible protein OsmY
MAGSVLRELRGNGATDAGPAPSSARAKPAARARSQAQDKRDAAAARAKAQPKRGAAGTRTKAQSKRPATRTRASARPKPEPKPLDDVTIARKVESTIFREIEVDKGKVDVNVAEPVVWLRGEVESQDLINELEARATGVIEVRRVENLIHVPETPAPGRTDTAALQPETEGSVARPEPPAVAAGAPSEEGTPPGAAQGTSRPVARATSGRRPGATVARLTPGQRAPTARSPRRPTDPKWPGSTRTRGATSPPRRRRRQWRRRPGPQRRRVLRAGGSRRGRARQGLGVPVDRSQATRP